MANTEKNQGNSKQQHGVKGQGGMQAGNSAGQQNDEQHTGTPNVEYDLVSILYHSLQGGETYAQYLEDCKQLGDEELTGFIHECIEQERQRAEKAKRILMRHMSGQQGRSMSRGSESENAGV
jgi:hypothetical protein